MGEPGYFRIGLADRLRGLLTGRVLSVHAVGTPTVFRSRFGGASFGIDYNAFGFGYSDDGPTLTIDEPAYMEYIACPACRQVVDVMGINPPPPDEMEFVRRLQARQRRRYLTPDAAPAGEVGS